jgi:alkylation response protein AidB-like acyl-CoA dehydrogenase
LDAVGVAQRLLREAGAYARLRAYQDPRTKDHERLSFELNEALVCARVGIEAALRAEEDESC